MSEAPNVFLRCSLCRWRSMDSCTLSPDWSLMMQITECLGDLRIHQAQKHGRAYSETDTDIAKEVCNIEAANKHQD